MRKKRTTRRSSASPSPEADSPAARETPRSTIINKTKRTVGYTSASALFELKASSPINNCDDGCRSLTTISDLKDFASSRFDNIKRNLVDRSHSEILKDLEASHSRLNKRSKIQTQACQQVMDEAEREYKKMSEWISESHEALKASYTEFAEATQVTASLVCKASIEELSKTFSTKIDELRTRFGISAT